MLCRIDQYLSFQSVRQYKIPIHFVSTNLSAVLACISRYQLVFGLPTKILISTEMVFLLSCELRLCRKPFLVAEQLLVSLTPPTLSRNVSLNCFQSAEILVSCSTFAQERSITFDLCFSFSVHPFQLLGFDLGISAEVSKKGQGEEERERETMGERVRVNGGPLQYTKGRV